jgi:hypothetical protein
MRNCSEAPMNLRDKAWSPYAAGILIGLLQIPAFLLIETALGTIVVLLDNCGSHRLTS